jgi:hypothetical protein
MNVTCFLIEVQKMMFLSCVYQMSEIQIITYYLFIESDQNIESKIKVN